MTRGQALTWSCRLIVKKAPELGDYGQTAACNPGIRYAICPNTRAEWRQVCVGQHWCKCMSTSACHNPLKLAETAVCTLLHMFLHYNNWSLFLSLSVGYTEFRSFTIGCLYIREGVFLAAHLGRGLIWLDRTSLSKTRQAVTTHCSPDLISFVCPFGIKSLTWSLKNKS